MEKDLTELIERVQISDLHVNYFKAIDEKTLTLSIVEQTFTLDAKIVKPNGAISIGHNDIYAGQTKSFSRFQATQHITSDMVVEFNSKAATIRTNLTAMHVWRDIPENPLLNGKYFHAGGVLYTKAIKVDDIWLISEWTFRNIWRTGEGMNEMAKFGTPKE